MPVTPYTVTGDGDWLERVSLEEDGKVWGVWRGEGIATGHQMYCAGLEMDRPR
jgi:hypothetical protein